MFTPEFAVEIAFQLFYFNVNVLRRIENYLRSTMEQEHTSDLDLLAIEQEAAQQLNIVASLSNLLVAESTEAAE